MNKLCVCRGLAVLAAAAFMAGCAGVRPIPDPRDPGPVRDSPELLRVCVVNGAGAHLALGDQVELTTSDAGRLTIRHIPGPNNKDGAWNGGETIKVRAAVLVEMITPRDGQKNTRRFVPVGRFKVRVGTVEHAPFDFLASKATKNLTNNPFPECNVDLGADELLIRGVEDEKRHGGDVILR
ncbi:MAG TPA: hypothetical protein VE907_17510 [Gammaproteobacteria bacterium]|nr:hypothetical protein [Gammaproteobacteria bacterium]